MTSVPFLAALLLCTACAFSQEQPSSATRSNRTAELDRSVATSVADPYKVDQFSIDPSRRAFSRGSQIDPMTVRSYGQPGDDTVCLKIRSYVVARDDKDSDSVHLVGYSTCQPASRYRLRTTQIQTDPSDR